MPSQAVIIRKPQGGLRALPTASAVGFPGLCAWSPASSATITAALDVDPGAWNVWRNRRITPAPLPCQWFRRASGNPLVYRVDHILEWLAHRAGEPFSAIEAWRQSLRTEFGSETTDPAEVRKLAHLYAEVTGPVISDVRFTPAGFTAYLNSLGATP